MVDSRKLMVNAQKAGSWEMEVGSFLDGRPKTEDGSKLMEN